MKIGIVTFHFAHNYGAMLQAFATQTYLRKLGHEAYIIDYMPTYHTRWFRRRLEWKDCIGRSPLFCYLNLKNKILHNNAISQRYDNFVDFYKSRFNLYYYQEADDMSFFDAVLLGSDQIWNRALTDGKFDSPYYGENFKCRVFSYAASGVSTSLNNYEEKEFSKRFRDMYGIGVRETRLLNLLQPLTEKEVCINVDPTLLIDSADYDILDLKPPCKEKYVLVYELQPDNRVQQMAQHYARANGLKTILLTGSIFHYTNKGFDLTASPEKFVSYIKNAECVFTSSFHGTALSIIFNTQFFSVKYNTPKDERVDSLLTQLGIGHQFINMGEMPVKCDIDFSEVNIRLEDLRKSSIQFLNKMLSF